MAGQVGNHPRCSWNGKDQREWVWSWWLDWGDPEGSRCRLTEPLLFFTVTVKVQVAWSVLHHTGSVVGLIEQPLRQQEISPIYCPFRTP